MPRHDALERRIGHRFADAALLDQALTHRSAAARHNERLEFLGDGVLDCVIAEELFRRFPDLPEGKLTRVRAQLVRKEALNQLGRSLGVADLVQVGPGAPLTPSILADAVEALFGAVFLDGGYDAARSAIRAAFSDLLSGVDPEAVQKDAKTRLQELMHARHKRLPEYSIVSEKLSAKANLFVVSCTLPDLGLTAQGSGASRQQAEQEAALAILERLA
ncbi:MAG TPA: ribonuclease III [Burkholderiales bacterium]|nr:ribonuclease III [Burkholderiales bacterium]